MKFKKIMSVLASAVMLSSTIGFAAAASYPTPFVVSGAENAAIVYGAAGDLSDFAAAVNIQTKLNALVTTGSATSVSGGDSYKIEKSSTKFQLGRGIRDVTTVSIGSDDMVNLLADGTYTDSDNDEFDYTQKIEMSNLTLTMFDDNDYATDDPTIGIKVSNGKNVLNYTLEFSSEPVWTDIDTTTLPLMGKEYYVLTTNAPTNTSITLMDSADSVLLSEGETQTVTVGGKSYECSVNFISSASAVKLEVNGEVTNSLSAGGTQKLADGAYVGVKEVMYTAKDTGISKVEFAIGKGKLKLTSGSDVEMNDNSISNLQANFSGIATTLSSISLIWNADDDLFIAPGSEIVMPGFEAVKMSFGGMKYTAEESIKIEYDGDNSIMLKAFPLKDSVEDINLVWTNATGGYNGTGKDDDNVLRTPGGTLGGVYNGSLTELLFDGDTDDYFVASWNDSTNSESYLMRVTNWNLRSTSQDEQVDFEYRKDGAWVVAKSNAKNLTTFSLGNVELKLGDVDKTAKTANVSAATTGTTFHILYSKEGMRMYLPWINVTTAHVNITGDVVAAASCVLNLTDFGTMRGEEGQIGTVWQQQGTTTISCNDFQHQIQFLFDEEDKNDGIQAGDQINLTATKTSTNNYVTLSDVIGEEATFKEIGETDIFRSIVHSALGTEILWNKADNKYTVEMIYHGDEAYGEVYVTAPDTVIVPGASGSGGSVLVVKDSEVDSVKDKNLIVVGGSCINTVAANILGGALCTEAFTAKTGAGVGQWIIKTVASPYAAADSGKIAMLVAGYNAADTTNAVNTAADGALTDIDTEQVYPITGTG